MTPSASRGVTRTLETVRDGQGRVTSRVRRTVLPGGLRVVTEQVPGVRSASVGVWVGVGSRDETPALHGCSHFLEHLLFKGTSRRSAMDISVALDAVGGEFNAFTAKEYTCFHARVLDDDLPLAVDVLGDMVTDSLVLEEDLAAEREVILDEIAMHDDDPDDVVHNLFARQAWGDSPLGRPIAGTVESISSLTRDQVARFYRRHYRPANMVVAAAGNVDHAAVVRMVKKSFSAHRFLEGDEPPVVPDVTRPTRRVHAGTLTATRPFEQVNLVLGVNGITRHDDRRYALGVLNTALGGGTSSRLFQEVREHRGLQRLVQFAHLLPLGFIGAVLLGNRPNLLALRLGEVEAPQHQHRLTGPAGSLVRTDRLSLAAAGSRLSRNRCECRRRQDHCRGSRP